MATSTSRNTICHLVHHRTLELEGGRTPDYNGVVLMDDMLLVIDRGESYLRVFNRHDGKLITSHILEDWPWGVCLINKDEVAVCLQDGPVVILSLNSRHGVKLVQTLQTGFYSCYSLVKWSSDKLVISGKKDDMLCWRILSITDGRLDSTHDICEGWWTNMAVRHDTVYISCLTLDSITNGVHAFNLLKPNKQKFLYQHQELIAPGSIMADRDYVYVCDGNRIHQLTDSGQLVTIHTVSSRPYSIFYDDQQGLLYTTSQESNVITVYKMESLHQPGIPVEILNMDDRSIQLFEDALKDGKETVYSIRIMVVGHVGVGKTTLVKRLLGEEVNIFERRSTEGIDVYVNCCDVSLSTCKWMRREKDSEQDYKALRLHKVLNENFQMSGSVADQKQDAVSPQPEKMDQNPIGIVATNEMNTEVLDQKSQHKIDQNRSSTASPQEESPSTDVQGNHIIPEKNTIPRREPGEINATESQQRALLREKIIQLKNNPDKAKEDIRKYAHLSIWDFAGQYSFYTTHQMFLTRRAIYLMVLNASEQITDDVEDDCYLDTAGKIKCKVKELVEIWLNSVHSCARSDKEGVNSANSSNSSLYSVIPPPVILVGTHIDQIQQRQSVIRANEECKQPQKVPAGMVTSTTTSKPDHSGEQLISSIVQESSQTSTERLQRKRRATEPVFSSSIQKGVTCADPKLLYQVLYNATQGALSNRSTLERNCQNVGLKFHGETPGNGNCFFEAVSSQLQRLKYPVQLSPQQLRQDAVAFLKDNQLLQVSDGYIDLAEFMCNESFEEYCTRMAEDGEWADHVLVVAMARTLQRDIMIVTSAPSSGNDDNVAWVVGQDNFQGDPILLGHIWEHHYESLEPTDSTELKVKCQRQALEKMGFDANDTKMDMSGKYGSQTVFLGVPDCIQDTINPIQDPMNQMSIFGNDGGDKVMTVVSGDDNFGIENPVQNDPHAQYNPQIQMNQMSMFGNDGGNKAMTVFSGDDNFGIGNPVQYDPQVQMNQMSVFGNDGGNKAMTVFSGDDNFGLENPVQYDPHFQMNQMDVFGHDGDHNDMPSFPVDNISGQINPIQDDVQSQMLITEDSSEHSQYSEDSSDDSLDSDDFDYEMKKCRKHGQKYLAEIRSYLSDKPTIVHLIDKDFAIDNSVKDSKLKKLKRKIFEVASQQPYWGEQIPTRWFLLEQQLIKLRDAGVKVISRSDVEKLNKEGTVQIKDNEEMDLFLTYLHETGTIIYFKIEVLRDNIILDPKWLIDALKLLINAHPTLPESSAENESQSDRPAIGEKWRDFKEKGVLSPELVDALWTKEKHPQLHANKDHLLRVMEQFNIIAKPRSFSENGEKVENYFLTPCMLSQESPREVISPEQDQRMVSTPVLCYIFQGKYLPPPIFHRLIAACITRWPVAKKKETSENLIFCGCCIFDLDLFHRLTLYCRNHIVFARITRMVIDEVKSLDAKLCTRVRRFISLNLNKITSYLSENLQYGLSVQCPSSQGVSDDSKVHFSPMFDIWLAEEGHAHDAPITPEHMNHARLCVALATVCGNAMREVLRTQVPAQHTDIYQAILANKGKLTGRPGRPLLNSSQINLVFPDPQGKKTGTLDQFDISLLYILIRNVSAVKDPVITGWGNDPQDQPRDTSLGASVERIRSFRNHITGHSADGKISRQDLEDYWDKFEAVIQDIEKVISGQMCSQELERQKRQVISVYEAC